MHPKHPTSTCACSLAQHQPLVLPFMLHIP